MTELNQDVVQVPPAVHLDAEEMLELLGRDQERRTGGEAHDHRVRDEVDQGPHAREAQCKLHQADHEGQGQGERHIVRRARQRHHRQGGKQHNRGRRRRSRDQVARRPEQGRDDGRHHPGIESVFGRHAGDGREGHGLRQHDQGPDDGGERIRLDLRAPDPGQPRHEWNQPGPALGDRRLHGVKISKGMESTCASRPSTGINRSRTAQPPCRCGDDSRGSAMSKPIVSDPPGQERHTAMTAMGLQPTQKPHPERSSAAWDRKKAPFTPVSLEQSSTSFGLK